MPDPHAHHPAIRRGHYEVQTFMMGQVSRPDPNGDDILRLIGSVPLLLRVVEAEIDMKGYMPPISKNEHLDMTHEGLVQLVAACLREGLIDPWDGRGSSQAPPVIAMETEAGLSFVQAVACLN